MMKMMKIMKIKSKLLQINSLKKLYSTRADTDNLRNVLDSNVKVGFIGLGAMGFHMASNLAIFGKLPVLYACDSAPAAISKLKKHLGAKTKVVECATPAQIAEHANVVITMLPKGLHVSEVYTGEKGLLSNLKKNSLLIDSSTIDVKTSKFVSSTMESAGAVMVDAPVSGGSIGAEAASLTFMVGTSDEKRVLPRVEPFLRNMGKKIVYCGAHGSGQAAKICNNMLLGISMIGVAETLNLASRLGIKPELMSQIINSSSGRCWSSDTSNPVPGVIPNVPSARNYDGGFATRLMLKDMGLAIDAARDSSSTVFMAGLAQQVYNQVSQTKTPKNEDMGSKDFGIVYQYLSTK